MSQAQKAYFPFLPNDRQGYIDFFSDNNTNKEPVVMEDGTSVQFPAGWTDEDADKWRKSMELERPDNYRAVSMDMLGLLTGIGVLPPHS
jgi:hypothetical protein